MKRRQFLRTSTTASIVSASSLGWLPQLAAAAEAGASQGPRRHCIVLWMGGAPSQIDTFDMKPNHENGGEFSEIATNVPGVRFSEHLPTLAKHADKLAIVRSLTSKEGDHERATYLVKTGVVPMGPMVRPQVAAALAHELCGSQDTLPPVVRIASGGFQIGRPIGPAYLGPRFLPLNVGSGAAGMAGGGGGDDATIHTGAIASLQVDSLARPPVIDDVRDLRRSTLWSKLEGRFMKSHPADSVTAHQTVYENARTLMTSGEADAFDLSQEDEALRRRYGVGTFGQGCLLARRLVESGVSFVEVALDRATLGGATWDTHSNNFRDVAALSAELDAGYATLLEDLADRGLLQTTTVVWMGEFGRTPNINSNAGRDHFPGAFCAVLAGGKTKAGQAYGMTSSDGSKIEENPVTVPEFLATVCAATGVDPSTMIMNDAGRPVPIVDASAISEIVG